MIHQFVVPEKILIGDNILETSDNVFSKYGKKALIITGPHVVKSVMMEELECALRKENIEYEVFSGITSEPTHKMIEEGVQIFKDGKCDFSIGIGGGSPLDSAKAIAAMSVFPGKISDYNGKEINGDIPPIIAIPTTAGTGSEATRFTIITDNEKDIKMLLKGDPLVPRLAIVDYNYSLSSPTSVTVATGLDALTHAVESYISKKAMPLTDVYSLSAVMKIMEWLPVAVSDGSNLEARKQMSIAALEAGICINNSSVTVVHGMSRPIGALFHVPHGISNAMLLTVCLEDMLNSATARFGNLGKAIGLEGIDDMEVANKFISRVKQLCSYCKVPTLEGYGIGEADFMEKIDKMSIDAIASGSPSNAPKNYSASDCRGLYIKAYK